MTIELDHMGLSVSDFERAKAFYVAALKPLGGGVIMEFPYGTVGPFAMAGLGVAGKPFFWITTGEKTTPHLHVAFRAETRDQVDEFYAAAMQAGGTDNGAPGLRLHYHANYYGAFVLDPDGHNIEAVCHASLAEMNAAARARRGAEAQKKVAKKAKKAAKKPAPRRRWPRRRSPRRRRRRRSRQGRSPGRPCASPSAADGRRSDERGASDRRLSVRRRAFPGRKLGRASICHCRMCQKAFGGFYGPLVTAHDLVWTRGAPKHFQSSNKVRRGFCAECGTPLTYEYDGGIELAIGAFDEPERAAPDDPGKPRRQALLRRWPAGAALPRCRRRAGSGSLQGVNRQLPASRSRHGRLAATGATPWLSSA